MKLKNQDAVAVACRYLADGYLAATSLSTNAFTRESYWADYYAEDVLKAETHIHLVTDHALVERLLVHGTSDQYFSDGYEAASALAEYLMAH